MSETRFRISTHENGYYCVSIPRYQGGEVVAATEHDRLNVLTQSLVDDLRFLRDTAFALHLNDRHKPEAFAACGHQVCQRTCKTWNDAVERLRSAEQPTSSEQE